MQFSSMMNLIAPTSGRLVIRKMGGESFALLGILHLPDHFNPTENAAYVMLVNEGMVSIVDEKLDDGVPYPNSCFGINAALCSSIWRKTTVKGSLVVRFIKQFDESNGWAVYGPSLQSLIEDKCFRGSHACFDIENGKMMQVSDDTVPIENGITCAQLLTILPVWPDAHGKLHCLTEYEQYWRSHYYRYSLLQAQYGAGEITKAELVEASNVDPDIRMVKAWYVDDEYCTYLASLRDLGGLCEIAPQSKECFAAREQLSKSAIEKAKIHCFV